MIINAFHRIPLVALLIALCNSLVGQPLEYRFSFPLSEVADIDSLSQMISIDNIEDGVVWAYASPREMNAFRQTGIAYELLPGKNASKSKGQMAKTVSEMLNWDGYPTYSVYDSLMRKFASDYPSICKLEVVCTLASGKQLLSVKISSDVNDDNTTKPELLCTGSMHGDEGVCMVTVLHLCHYLLDNYQKIDNVTNLVNNAELWMLPLYNPDGMYCGGDNVISGSTRGNANSVDLNRDFPHVDGSEPHPYEDDWQQETLAMMDFFKKHHFTLSANIHSNNECFNYPWDTWKRPTADDEWWKLVGGSYRDTAQKYGRPGFFSDDCYHDVNGLTNGYEWYPVKGSQQDYANFFAHCREVTIEISSLKTVDASVLPKIWEYNHRSLLNYFAEGLNGVSGVVTDICGNPLHAVVAIAGFDKDNSWVETDARAGDYHRLLKAGTYNLTFSAEGYVPQTVEVVVADGQPLTKNIILDNGITIPQLAISPVVLDVYQKVDTVGYGKIVVSNVGNSDNSYVLSADTSAHWLSFNKTSAIIDLGKKDTVNLTIDSHDLQSGDYSTLIRFSSVSQTTFAEVRLTVQPRDEAPQDSDTVQNAEIAAVTIAHNPDKLEYIIGDSLNLAGGTINVTYNNDSTSVVAMCRDMVVSFDSCIVGAQDIVLKYGEYTVTFNVFVSPKEEKPIASPVVVSVSIESLPERLTYGFGDAIDLTGGTLNVKYGNGESEIVPMKNEMLVGWAGQVVESNNVVIKVGNCSTVFSITLSKAEPPSSVSVKSIAISSLPCKLTYQIGDTLDLDGATLNVTYNNDSTVSVAVADTMVTGFDSDSLGSKMLTITYLGCKMHFYVNVTGIDDAIPDSEVSRLKVYAGNGAVIIDNADSEILIFDLSGHLVCINAGRCGHVEIALPKSAVYIVKIGDRTQRVVVE